MITNLDPAAAHQRQQKYVDKIREAGFDIGLTVGHAFVESIRDIGYKTTGTALNELVDNAAQAGAENVHVAFGYPDGSRKPNTIAVLDDGIGMVPEMARASLLWGGTDRHNDRELFGRFGYGLPSASVSQGRRVEVYSRVDTGPFYCAYLDLNEIRDGKHLDGGRVTLPKTQPRDLPSFVTQYARESFPEGLESVRTVIVLMELDRPSYTTSDRLENHLLETFGVTYRNHLRRFAIEVNGTPVDAVDPLFTTEGGRFFDLDKERAEPIEPIVFDVRDRETREVVGTVHVRWSLMPPTFARIDKTRDAIGKNANKRWPILRDHNGVIVMRAGRQIDVVTKGLPTTFVNYDRYIGLEVDFPPTLDGWFGVTTHKQQITLSERILQLLDDNGVWKTLEQLRRRAKEMRSDLTAEYDSVDDFDGKRPSEVAIEEASELDSPAPESERRTRREQEGYESAVRGLVEKGVSRSEAEQVIESVEKERPFRVEVDSVPEGPFYRVELRGGQLVLLINSAHRFYTDVYAAAKGVEGARIRQALEVLLFVLGKSEIDATGNLELFYQSERQEWSRRLNVALAKLGVVIDLTPEEPEPIDSVGVAG